MDNPFSKTYIRGLLPPAPYRSVYSLLQCVRVGFVNECVPIVYIEETAFAFPCFGVPFAELRSVADIELCACLYYVSGFACLSA